MKNTVATWRWPWIGTHSPCHFRFVLIMQEGQLCGPASHGGTHRLPWPPWAGGQGLPISYSHCILWPAQLGARVGLCSDLCSLGVWKSPVSELLNVDPRVVMLASPADTRESLVHGKPRGNVWLLQIFLLQWSCWQEQCNYIIYHEVCSLEPPPLGREKDLN